MLKILNHQIPSQLINGKSPCFAKAIKFYFVESLEKFIDFIQIGERSIKFQTRGKVKKIPPPRFAKSLVVRNPLWGFFSNVSDAKAGRQYVVLFFELSYYEWII